MRITVCAKSSLLKGGIETYLAGVVPYLEARGHQIDYWYETDSYQVELMKAKSDLLFFQNSATPAFFDEVIGHCPSVFVLHDYHGMCISGRKFFSFPDYKVCEQALGTTCMVRYFPNRCGGLNPIRMVKEYFRQKENLRHLKTVKRIVTLSNHMRETCLKNGISESSVVHIPFFPSQSTKKNSVSREFPRGTEPWRLIWIGRMQKEKGAEVFLDAVNTLSKESSRPMEVVLMGDGAERPRLEQKARLIQFGKDYLNILFLGWRSRDEISNLMANQHLLIFSSLWPEPYGLIGIEAIDQGLPVVAFNSGGVPEWLLSGVSGESVSLTGESSENLVNGINRVMDPERYTHYREGTKRHAQSFSPSTHALKLEELFTEMVPRELNQKVG